MDVDSDSDSEIDSHSETNSYDDMDALLNDRFRDVAQAEGIKEGMNEDAKKFYDLVEEASKELYPDCKGFSTLSFTIPLYLLKCQHGWSNASFTSLLELLKEAVPNLNIPTSFNKAKTMVRDLGLDYKKIDACPNDCMLYWKEYEKDTSCHECGASRWIVHPVVEADVLPSRKSHNIPVKTLRHFPLIPRLQRLFMCSATAKSMRWHDEERRKDDKLRHPADGQSWKEFDNRHTNFALDTRNVRLGLSSDGFNPYRTMSISHSTWPVVLMAYNLPPWMSMKQEYFMLSLLIPGPKSPGNDIDIYLQPLIEELKELWEVGVETYDASKNETFQMYAALMWTISDFPAYAMLSGWSTKGKLACPCCNHGTCSNYLKYSRKTCYMGHRAFLPEDHPWRANKRSFNGKVEHRQAPPLLSGTEALSQLEYVDNLFGKLKPKKDGPWKKRSIFFDLPYWQYNTSRHNLDVMHIEKNIVDSILGTLLDISGKTKDHTNARYDLQEMGIRKNLHPKKTNGRKKVKLAKACYSMTNAEKSIFCDVLKTAKLPDGSASNISRCVNLLERRISGYKTHDAHFILHYLLQIPIKGILPDQVAVPLIRLGSFFRQLCQKSITLQEIDQLEEDIVTTLCQLERIFPPSFFDIMIHLPIHLANEVRLGGPVQFRWMYPPERYMCTLKSYVRNRSRPEGSIAEAYLVEECLTFCSRYLHSGVQTKLNRQPRNNDEPNNSMMETTDAFSNLFPKRGVPLGAKKGEPFLLDDKSREQVHSYILLNCHKIDDYVSEHETYQQGTRWMRAKNHSKNFPTWFKTRALRHDVPNWIKELSRGPTQCAKRYSGYFINGYRFHTRQREVRRKTQNSGVTLVALTTSFASTKDANPIHENVSYYGRVNDIIELDYYGNFKVTLFKCDWYEAREDAYGSTYVHFNKKCYQEEPFVLACQVHQCFYVQDAFDKNKHYVMKTVPRDLFSISDQVAIDVEDTYENEPFDNSTVPSIPNDDGEVDLVRNDLNEVLVDVAKEVYFSQEYNTGSDEEYDSEDF
ncbi:uncharacterized protein LOC130966327 [Arachis stenosperma]|uniref:uncharacterized protein LOC130966327 n=1 Tax=Arachis stenosperma TaxID=217475 RepID=UPI0025ABC345|nr:uncharacterized protein LOC130966327 [Arachis stenosperma]